MRIAVVALIAVACGKSEPARFVAQPLYVEGLPKCPGAGNAYQHPLIIKVTEPDRQRTTKDVFFDAPSDKDGPYHFTVDRSKHRVEVAFGTCAETFDPSQKRFDCEAKTITWYATTTVEIAPEGRNAVRFTPPTEPIACVTGVARAPR